MNALSITLVFMSHNVSSLWLRQLTGTVRFEVLSLSVINSLVQAYPTRRSRETCYPRHNVMLPTGDLCNEKTAFNPFPSKDKLE